MNALPAPVPTADILRSDSRADSRIDNRSTERSGSNRSSASDDMFARRLDASRKDRQASSSESSSARRDQNSINDRRARPTNDTADQGLDGTEGLAPPVEGPAPIVARIPISPEGNAATPTAVTPVQGLTPTVLSPADLAALMGFTPVDPVASALDAIHDADADPLLSALAQLLGMSPASAETVGTAKTGETGDQAADILTPPAPGKELSTVPGTAGLVPTLAQIISTDSTTADGESPLIAGQSVHYAQPRTPAAMPTATEVQMATDSAGAASAMVTSTSATTASGDSDTPPQSDTAPKTIPALTASSSSNDQASVSAPTFQSAVQRAEAADTSVTKPQRPAAAPDASNPMDRAVANQVSRALVRQNADGTKSMWLRLTPPELGTVRIEIIERAGVMQAHIHAEDDGVRQAIERQLPSMRQDLRSHNAPISDVQLSDHYSGDWQRDHNSRGQSQRGHSDGAPRRPFGRQPFSIDGVSAPPNATRASAATPLTATITDSEVDARA